MYFDLFFYCLLTSLVSVGFYLVTEKNYLLHFIKRPVEEWIDNLESEKNIQLSLLNNDEAKQIGFIINKYSLDNNKSQMDFEIEREKKHFKSLREAKLKYYEREIDFLLSIYKPIFFCPRCMASVWSLIIFLPIAISNHGANIGFSFLIPAMLITATLNSLLHKLIEQ